MGKEERELQAEPELLHLAKQQEETARQVRYHQQQHREERTAFIRAEAELEEEETTRIQQLLFKLGELAVLVEIYLLTM